MKVKIDKNNWPGEFPETPEAAAEIVRDGDYIVVHYTVRERALRAEALEDQEPVWEDSCAEFFCQRPGEDSYLNFEVNCIGTLVATRRKGRALDVQPFPPEVMRRIERRCSLPHERIASCIGDYRWEAELRIPLDLIYGDEVPPVGEPIELRGNFYKCGDKTPFPHFVSWNPIVLPHPEFHSPQFFGVIRL